MSRERGHAVDTDVPEDLVGGENTTSIGSELGFGVRVKGSKGSGAELVRTTSFQAPDFPNIPFLKREIWVRLINRGLDLRRARTTTTLTTPS